MSNDCGGCAYFQKLKNMVGNSGICNANDCRTDEDCGHGCKDFKAPKYDRKHIEGEEKIYGDQ